MGCYALVMSISQDLRFAIRMLLKSPGTTGMALVTLALGIGASVTLFSLVDTLYLRPIQVPEPQQVVYGYGVRPENRGLAQISFPDALYYRDHSTSFDALAVHYPGSPLHVRVGDQPVSIIGSVVTGNYFSLLRLEPQLGRFFTAAEDSVPDRDAVTVISDRFWRNRMGGDPQAIGKTLQINGRAFTIIGVAPRGFDGVARGSVASQVFMPSAMFGVGYRYCNALIDRGCKVVEMLGRLKPSVSRVVAQSEIDVLSRQLSAQHPVPGRGEGVRLVAARGAFPSEPNREATVIGLLVGGVALLVLIACANIGGLLLARGTARTREVTIRLALGAGRLRIVRQFFTESVVLAAAGTALGVLVAEWGNDMVRSFYGANYAGMLFTFDIVIRGPVLAATAAVSATTAILCGLAPALQAARTDTLPALKVDSAGSVRTRSRGRNVLVIAQLAMSIVLLIGAGLLVRTVAQLYAGPGIDPGRIVLLRLRPSLVGMEATRARQFQRTVLEKLQQIPGVEAAATAENLPLLGYGNDVVVTPVGGSVPGRRESTARASYVGDRYFDVIGLPLVAGRDFNSSDRPETPMVAIVDERVAASLGGSDRAVGQIVRLDETEALVIGVARNAQYSSMTDPIYPFVYLDYWQQDGRGFASDSRTHVRVSGDAQAMMPALRAAIAAVDPSVPINEDYPLRERVKFGFQRVRLAMTILVGFGIFALVLSSIGVYGIVAFVASMRTREIAIRMALGADRTDVRGMIVRDGLWLAVPGALAGVVAAFGASRFLGSLLLGVDPHDPVVFASIPLLLITVAMIASYIPLRKATRIDPSVALRDE